MKKRAKSTVYRRFCVTTSLLLGMFLIGGIFASSTGSKASFQNTSNLSVAVVVPSRSQPSWHDNTDSSLATVLLPSLQRTLTFRERRSLKVEVIIVFDKGDTFWENRVVRAAVESTVLHPVSVQFMSVKKTSRIPHNEGCQLAYERGADYIIRVNDDTEFTGVGWLTSAMGALQGFKPTNFGVVGPTCQQGNMKILTHDMVHRTHLDIFKDYYPPEFDNWWLDDWVSNVYGSRHTQKLKTWTVIHHTDAYGQRYKESREQANILPQILIRSKQQIIDFLTLEIRAERSGQISTSADVIIFPASTPAIGRKDRTHPHFEAKPPRSARDSP